MWWPQWFNQTDSEVDTEPQDCVAACLSVQFTMTLLYCLVCQQMQLSQTLRVIESLAFVFVRL